MVCASGLREACSANPRRSGRLFAPPLNRQVVGRSREAHGRTRAGAPVGRPATLEAAGNLSVRRGPAPDRPQAPALGGLDPQPRHRAAWLVLAGSVVIAVGPRLVVLASGRASPTSAPGAIAGSIVALS